MGYNIENKVYFFIKIARLESVCGLIAHRGFESRPLRQDTKKTAYLGGFFTPTPAYLRGSLRVLAYFVMPGQNALSGLFSLSWPWVLCKLTTVGRGEVNELWEALPSTSIT